MSDEQVGTGTNSGDNGTPSECEKRFAGMQRAYNELKAETDAKIQELTALNEKLKGQITAAEATRDQLQSEVSELTAKLQEATSGSASLQQKYEQQLKALEDRIAAKSNAETEMESIKAELAGKQEELEKLKQIHHELELEHRKIEMLPPELIPLASKIKTYEDEGEQKAAIEQVLAVFKTLTLKGHERPATTSAQESPFEGIDEDTLKKLSSPENFFSQK